MSGYSPSGYLPESVGPSLSERVSDLEAKVDVLGKVMESVAKFFGYKPKVGQ